MRFAWTAACGAASVLLVIAAGPVWGQTLPQSGSAALPAGPQTPAGTAAAQAPAGTAPRTVVCSSRGGERQECPADTSAGVALLKATGTSACLLGKTWGYDDANIWVTDGCSGEFQLGQIAEAAAAGPAAPAPPGPPNPYEPVESWGEFEPGQGFLVGRSGVGELEISAYALIRYINQT